MYADTSYAGGQPGDVVVGARLVVFSLLDKVVYVDMEELAEDDWWL